MSSLVTTQIIDYIKKKGFITIDMLMQKSLSDFNGYYQMDRDHIGPNGDFITSPEISQIFGEIIGIWCIEQYQKLGFPSQINIVELGSGRGSLMRDLLKAAKLLPQFYKALQVSLLEINPAFKVLQKNKLSNIDLNITWVENIEILSKIPTIFIANEFFDALAIKQYIKSRNNWREQVVAIGNNTLCYDTISIPPLLNTHFLTTYRNADCGAILEKSELGENFMSSITYHISKYFGAALIIDYGYKISPQKRSSNQYTSTLQAVKNHKFHPILKDLGEADLSAHVDFFALIKHAKKYVATTSKLITQQEFLVEYGINIRKKELQKNLPLLEKNILERQVERLISPKYMGKLFQVLSIFKYN